ncbi:MAG TPA: alanine--tRNA ligase, partial [Chloroflexota bacterium]
SVDTGMGFERMCTVLQGVRSSYETDLFLPIIERTMALTGGDEEHYRAHQVAYKAVADHTRACAFLIADGILPGNGNRSYVLRRILRRAAYQGRTIGLTKPFLAQTAAVVIETMGDAYPELRRRRDFILQSLTDEEERFGRTISSGLTLLDQELAGVAPAAPLPGKAAFTLYDTFGFPRDLTERIAAERGHPVDMAGYDTEMEAQRARGRAGAQFKRGSEAELWAGQDLPATDFQGYGSLTGQGKVLALIVEGDEAGEGHAGQAVQVVLDSTPFYAQGGGQVGDTGTLSGPNGQVRVTDTQRPIPGLIVHLGIIEEGTISLGDRLEAAVDAERRQDIQRNHTATHLLHRVAREVLGDHAAQAGSLVAPDRLRFDFTHGRAIAPEQLREIEHRVNEWIRADTPVGWIVTDYQDAIGRGAMALFGEKYGDQVRMVTAGCEQGDFCSRELCGGTHVARTGEIGFFRVLQESSSAGGIRRIEAVTGRGAEEWALSQAGMVREAAARLGAPPVQILERIDGLLDELRQQRRQIEHLRLASGQGAREALLEQVQSLGDARYLAAKVEAADSKGLDELGDWLRDKLGSAVIVLGAVLGEKPQVLALVTPDLAARGYHAGNLVKRLAPIIGGGGGGRSDRASAGGRDSTKLDEALAQVPVFLSEVGVSR